MTYKTFELVRITHTYKQIQWAEDSGHTFTIDRNVFRGRSLWYACTCGATWGGFRWDKPCQHIAKVHERWDGQPYSGRMRRPKLPLPELRRNLGIDNQE